MSRTVSTSSGKPYGLARVCRVGRASRATIYRHLSPSRPEPPRRPGPVGPMPDPALREAIRAVLTASPFHGEGHRKVWARLRVAGVRTSKRFSRTTNHPGAAPAGGHRARVGIGERDLLIRRGKHLLLAGRQLAHLLVQLGKLLLETL